MVDLYNGSKSTNFKTGSVKPKSIPIVASSFDVEDVAGFVVFFVRILRFCQCLISFLQCVYLVCAV